ncbi:MAG: hypothetical protein NZ901_04200 [Geminocystis sp.]|nr:hypothetical protein [Geminocystis sp.]HIK38537.1 hypothetical protein [Geminocystis sp. M7585_C2015_104]MCS7147374.1 hypothetical protein [Geminocystis sp.]MCX8079044.1 hypothetical protein [Geminocystis sp.]MDW8117064.1 hypothetical protein [Geminocystis sp.]
MNLEAQLAHLVAEAPKYGVPSIIMEKGVIPVISAFAQQLGHTEYYLRQTTDNNLVLTILANEKHPELEKKVIYAFPTAEDATQFPDNKTSKLEIVPQAFPVSQILFQMFTMKEVDSIIFIDNPQQYQQSKEIYCHKLQAAIRQSLTNLVNAVTNNSRIV